MKQIKLWCWAAPSALMLSVSVQASSVGLAELLDAVEGNPQVQEGQAELRSAEAGLNLANLQSAPRIRLSLDNDLAHSDDATRRAEVKVEKSLFDWGKAQALVEVAQARKASKELNACKHNGSTELIPLKTYFEEAFFETKSLVYLGY